MSSGYQGHSNEMVEVPTDLRSCFPSDRAPYPGTRTKVEKNVYNRSHRGAGKIAGIILKKNRSYGIQEGIREKKNKNYRPGICQTHKLYQLHKIRDITNILHVRR